MINQKNIQIKVQKIKLSIQYLYDFILYIYNNYYVYLSGKKIKNTNYQFFM